MYLRHLERELVSYFDSGLTVEMEGPPGVGKSDSIEQLVKKWSERDGFEWGFGVAFLATYTPIDLLGYMIPVKKEIVGPDGVSHTTMVSEYTIPPWMFCRNGKPLNSYKKAVLLLDEYDKGEPDVKKTSAELLLKKKIGPHALGPNVFVVAASNRVQDRSGSTKSFDFVINRRGLLKIEPDFESWEAWALGEDIPPIFTLFPKKYPDLVFSGTIPKDQGPFCTPRSYVAGIRLLMKRAELGVTKAANYGFNEVEEAATIQELLNGVIGDAAATQLAGWLRMRLETPDIEDILKDPEHTPIPAKPDAKMLVAHECAYRADGKNLGTLITYIKRMSQEFHITFARASIKRKHALLAHPDMMAFTKGNQALMAAIG